MIRLFTPLVVGVTLVVSALAIGRMVLSPETWPSSLVALAFLPLVLGVLAFRARRDAASGKGVRTFGKVRAALVGAGAALGAGLMLSMAESFGFSEQTVAGKWGTFGTLLIAFVAVVADLITARLEQKAHDDD